MTLSTLVRREDFPKYFRACQQFTSCSLTRQHFFHFSKRKPPRNKFSFQIHNILVGEFRGATQHLLGVGTNSSSPSHSELRNASLCAPQHSSADMVCSSCPTAIPQTQTPCHPSCSSLALSSFYLPRPKRIPPRRCPYPEPSGCPSPMVKPPISSPTTSTGSTSSPHAAPCKHPPTLSNAMPNLFSHSATILLSSPIPPNTPKNL